LLNAARSALADGPWFPAGCRVRIGI
jgi:hypothetical protein